MRLIIGLGNPSNKYENTRHNVGFVVLDELKNKIFSFSPSQRLSGAGGQIPMVRRARHPEQSRGVYNQFLNSDFQFEKKFNADILKLDNLMLAKPQTFMNSSGASVKKLVVQYKIIMADLWVIHDDLDLRLGAYKIQRGVGPKLHYGTASIEEQLGRKDFWRVRVGLDNRPSDNRVSGEEYVLQNFGEIEIGLRDGVIERVVEVLIQRLNVK
ncbi:hypothetical protein A2962_04155 [Candidatus Woesebacteria bacterium RIFCSPLOWO2_01_FULL_39_61]|uniref:Peptidyl-tRNA hydrolase n=1 Tax=Candidatus Woesebacteria bacterium RIFCSPHIGHO2_02_FULL_39_13 TaxID=1802505 RepID=A0A1F7YXR9_9BACT|nr:MAG: hypothetical protein A2692_00510 [Candidatus Woesebacteria bacterium RIFCSPHIGHO2_01_FULL_39_95]OGM32156.1 MAG: hypothetical protein A3D01_02095 [Candidatus Woesebacteria bacterium RIFCSPHIGHO2_02_FULL_39_13]OGM36605.1 MAG: hypothetical protein A3E13_02930 [Candidatus Woesebacteria bacterium RIFCSPHIGHO2_12_FULL_40_20]OGM65946.1 MAG: hypothetical protein A2962_04155 [Candidatus Woesebacteria bacterium RIFCSPLOWO2_01_FULL_39_61]OGM71412.1 MAG: hypothetical protein A3H19_04575 [Candidatus